MELNRMKAAAVTAVVNYLLEEEAAALAQAARPDDEYPVAAGLHPVNAWGASGRQAQMQMRNLMQMRTFQGARLR